MLYLLVRSFLTLKIAINDMKNCTIAKSKSFPMSNETKSINIVDEIRDTVVSSNTVNKIENIAIGMI